MSGVAQWSDQTLSAQKLTSSNPAGGIETHMFLHFNATTADQNIQKT